MKDPDKGHLFLHIIVFSLVMSTGIVISKETGSQLIKAFCGGFFFSGFFISMCIASANPHESGAKSVYIFYAIYLLIVFTIRWLYS